MKRFIRIFRLAYKLIGVKPCVLDALVINLSTKFYESGLGDIIIRAEVIEEAEINMGKGNTVKLEDLPRPVGISRMQDECRRLYHEIRLGLWNHAFLRVESLANRFGGMHPDEGNVWNVSSREICPVCGSKIR